MNCRRTEELIPLYVGSDLDPSTSAAVRDHLASCGDCAILANQFDQSRRWLDNATPGFEEALFEEMKCRVMRDIGALESRRGVRDWLMRSIVPIFGPRRLVFAAALLALAAGILFLLYSSRAGLTKPDEQRARDEHDAPQTPGVARASDDSDRDNPAPHQRHHRRKIRIRHDVEMPAAQVAIQKAAGTDIREVFTEPEGGDQMLRIEIQTSDPNIRIIWFAPKEIDSQTRPVTDFE